MFTGFSKDLVQKPTRVVTLHNTRQHDTTKDNTSTTRDNTSTKQPKICFDLFIQSQHARRLVYQTLKLCLGCKKQKTENRLRVNVHCLKIFSGVSCFRKKSFKLVINQFRKRKLTKKEGKNKNKLAKTLTAQKDRRSFNASRVVVITKS